MALRDYQESYLTTAGSETLGGYATSQSDYRDAGAANQEVHHKKRYLNILGLTELTADGAETVTITLQTDTAVTFDSASVKDAWSSIAIPKASVDTYTAKVLIPEDMYRYRRIVWTISGTSTAGGTFYAWESED